MAFIVEQPGSSRWTVTRRIYPAQEIAKRHKRLDLGAMMYWATFRHTGDPDEACQAALRFVYEEEWDDDEFQHFLWKRKP